MFAMPFALAFVCEHANDAKRKVKWCNFKFIFLCAFTTEKRDDYYVPGSHVCYLFKAKEGKKGIRETIFGYKSKGKN